MTADTTMIRMVAQHVGMGVARRAAEHERRRAEREADEAEIDLPDEDERVAVAAREVLATIALDSPHYAPKPQREDKRKRRAVVRGKKSGALEVLAGARVMAEQMEEQAGVLGTAVLAGDAADGGAAAAAAFAAGSATAAGAGDEDDEVALPELSLEFLMSAHADRPMQDDEPVGVATDLAGHLRTLRNTLRIHIGKMEENAVPVRMVRGDRGALYPEWQFTSSFATKLLSWRQRQSHVTRRSGKEVEGRVAKTAGVWLNHMQNHLWRELWPGMPSGEVERQYWRRVRKQFNSMTAGGGGGMLEAGRAAGEAARRAATAHGVGAARAAAFGDQKAKEVVDALRAATQTPCTKEHLHQTGEYQMQDVLLTEPFRVNEACVLNAYVGLARSTGCRPCMAVSNSKSDLEAMSPWHGQFPLTPASLRVGELEAVKRPLVVARKVAVCQEARAGLGAH